MNRRRCFRFAYPAAVHKDRDILPFQMRDGEAALFLMAALAERGYRFEDTYLNYPSPGPDLIPVDLGGLQPTDLILLCTRPPMHDRVAGDRKEIRRSYTTLEDELFKGPLARHIEYCARSEVRLTPSAAATSPQIAMRRSTLFRQHGGAMYESYGAPETRDWTHFKDRQPLSAAFLVYSEHAWPDGPAFLAAFGMGGTETLVWCRALAKRFAPLLCETSFAMAELRALPTPEPPDSTRFADSWEITLLGAAPLTRGPKRAA